MDGSRTRRCQILFDIIQDEKQNGWVKKNKKNKKSDHQSSYESFARVYIQSLKPTMGGMECGLQKRL